MLESQLSGRTAVRSLAPSSVEMTPFWSTLRIMVASTKYIRPFLSTAMPVEEEEEEEGTATPDVMLVERPAAQAAGVQLVALQRGGPLLPEDETGTGLIFVSHRHYMEGKRGRRRGRRGHDTKKVASVALPPSPQRSSKGRHCSPVPATTSALSGSRRPPVSEWTR
ncbi:hypothetical protein EYF80_054655 [Liparis tanakae]|uniref:Uncharacterized protein n=1 Tax=Liparis tanakae TaxID=230148 RepID=A0A4Z2F3W0_9TELE|nr:hypothetical protein EYF80_054655 [Liparis tanakae]